MPPIPAQFASPASVSGASVTGGEGGWRLFPPRSSVEDLRGKGKGKEMAVEMEVEVEVVKRERKMNELWF
jgi:hypothetical protein